MYIGIFSYNHHSFYKLIRCKMSLFADFAFIFYYCEIKRHQLLKSTTSCSMKIANNIKTTKNIVNTIEMEFSLLYINKIQIDCEKCLHVISHAVLGYMHDPCCPAYY